MAVQQAFKSEAYFVSPWSHVLLLQSRDLSKEDVGTDIVECVCNSTCSKPNGGSNRWLVPRRRQCGSKASSDGACLYSRFFFSNILSPGIARPELNATRVLKSFEVYGHCVIAPFSLCRPRLMVTLQNLCPVFFSSRWHRPSPIFLSLCNPILYVLGRLLLRSYTRTIPHILRVLRPYCRRTACFSYTHLFYPPSHRTFLTLKGDFVKRRKPRNNQAH